MLVPDLRLFILSYSHKFLRTAVCSRQQIWFSFGVVYLMCSARQHVCACALQRCRVRCICRFATPLESKSMTGLC